MNVKALVGVGALAVAAMALLVAFPSGVPGLIDITGDRLAPPPELRIATPSDGEGVGSTVRLAGDASSSAQAVVDVQYRIDGGRWESVPLTVRGQRATPFEADIELPEGDHVLEARAYDGESLSLTARVQVRRDAPTVRIATPADGDGLDEGLLLVSGAVRGHANEVLLEVDGAQHVVPVTDSAWTATVRLAPGEHSLVATALGTPRSLPHAIRVAAGSPAPPAVTVLTPRDASAYGAAGDLACGGGCILLTGSAPRASIVRVELDGALAGEAGVLLGSWSYRLPTATLANGTHHLSVRGFAGDGTPSVARDLTLLARTPHGLALRGSDAPAPTGTELLFEVAGVGADRASWWLDGAALGTGPQAIAVLSTPGDHVLSVQAATPRGGSASASIVLHALNRAPSVHFPTEPTMVDGDIELRVEAEDPDGAVVAYAWDFGDDTSARTHLPTVRHRYAERGVFTATVTAVDDLGLSTSAVTAVAVANAPPVAAFSWAPERPTVLDVVTLNDTSLDHDGVLVERAWLLPDGNVSQEAAPALRFRERGDHVLGLRVIDNDGFVTVLEQTIHVVNVAPEAAFLYAPALPAAHEDILFADTSVDPDGPITDHTWDFGDNTTAGGDSVLHTYRRPGTYVVNLTVIDDLGAVANVSRNVTVLDSAPAIRAVTAHPAEPAAQEEVRLAVVADDRDGGIIAAHWELGDGTFSNDTEPAHRYARSGTYFGNVTVFDEGGLNVTFPFSLRVRNALPDVSLAARPGGSIAAFPTFLAANASDPDGRITYYRFDGNGDGRMDCETTEPVCAYVYETAGSYLATVIVEDDEGATAQTELLLDVVLPPADHPPPRVTVESPARHTTLRGEHLHRGEATGPREIVKVDLQLRAGAWAYSGSRDAWRAASGTGEWRALVDTRGFADGAYELVVRATDAAGGVGYARVPITIENGPRVSDVTLQLIEAPLVIEEDVVIRASAFHPEGVTGIRYRVDGQDWVQETENPLAFTIDVDRDALKPGEHVLRVEAYRGVHEMASATHVFSVPGTAPILVVDEAPNSVAHALLRAHGRIIGEGRAQWRVDQGLWHDLPPGPTWNMSEDTLDLRGGRHVLQLRAISPDGRLTSELHSYKIDVINPPFTNSTVTEPKPPAPRSEVPGPAVAPVLLALLLAAGARRARRK